MNSTDVEFVGLQASSVELYAELISRGLSPLPIAPGHKYPGYFNGTVWLPMPGWDAFTKRKPTNAEICLWGEWPRHGLGICCGEVSGVVAIDYDELPEFHEKVKKILPTPLVCKKGAKGFTAFYQWNAGIENRKFIVDGKTVVEILTTGRQTVIPPAIHPNGAPYTWLGPSLCEVFPYQHPEITAEHLRAIEAVFLPEREREEKQERARDSIELAQNSGGFSAPTIERVREALNKINPDCTYNEWVEIGMGMKSAFPGNDGCALFSSWSAGGSKFKVGEPEKKWRSFGRKEGITIATVFHHAIACGWVWHEPDEILNIVEISPNLSAGGKSAENNGDNAGNSTGAAKLRAVGPETVEPIDISGTIKNAPSWFTTKIYKNFGIPDEIALRAPGIVGETVRWIVECSLLPQPALALGASLAYFGAIKGQRVALESGLGTNLLVMSVARSGVGKNRALECINRLATESSTFDYIAGKPASGTALISCLKNNIKAPGVRLVLWDEIGHYLRCLFKGQDSMKVHQNSIISTIMEIYGYGNTTFLGFEYANHKGDMVRAQFDKPCLCIYGTTTPVTIYETFSHGASENGFVPRFLFFGVEHQRAKPNFKHRPISSIPISILDNIERIMQLPRNTTSKGNLDERVEPTIVPMSEEAETLMREARAYFNYQQSILEDTSEDSALDAIWARSLEHALHVALIISNDQIVQESDLRFALELVSYCTAGCVAMVKDKLISSHTEKITRDLLQLIESYGDKGIARSVLLRKRFCLNGKQLSDILLRLQESQTIEIIEVKGTRKPTQFYVATEFAEAFKLNLKSGIKAEKIGNLSE